MNSSKYYPDRSKVAWLEYHWTFHEFLEYSPKIVLNFRWKFISNSMISKLSLSQIFNEYSPKLGDYSEGSEHSWTSANIQEIRPRNFWTIGVVVYGYLFTRKLEWNMNNNKKKSRKKLLDVIILLFFKNKNIIKWTFFPFCSETRKKVTLTNNWFQLYYLTCNNKKTMLFSLFLISV